MAELKALGLNDYYILNDGPQNNAISLGVFKTEEAANKFHEAIKHARRQQRAGRAAHADDQRRRFVVLRDPQPAQTEQLQQLKADFAGSEVKIGPCDRELIVHPRIHQPACRMTSPIVPPSATRSGPRTAPPIARRRATLFLEYAKWLDIDLCFQGFNEELATLPGAYAPPSGRLFLADADDRRDRPAASRCAGWRPTRRRGVRAEAAVGASRVSRTAARTALTRSRARRGARDRLPSIKLDTLPAIMPKAVAMYRALGFTDCAPYYHNQIPGSLYMERAL